MTRARVSDSVHRGCSCGPRYARSCTSCQLRLPRPCSERWLGTGEAEGRGGFGRRCRRLPDRQSCGAEPSRGGAFVRVLGCAPGTGWMRPSPRRGGWAGDWCDYAPKWLWARCLIRGGGAWNIAWDVQPALACLLNENRLFCWDNLSYLKHSGRLYLSPNHLYHFNLKAF